MEITFLAYQEMQESFNSWRGNCSKIVNQFTDNSQLGTVDLSNTSENHSVLSCMEIARLFFLQAQLNLAQLSQV